METKKEMIFTEKPSENCHASTVLPLPNGEVLAAWFGGTKEGKDDVDIWYSHRSEAGWSTPCRITAAPDIPHWNPVLNLRSDGSVILFFKVGKKIPHWQTYFCISADNGLSWTEAQKLVPGDVGGRGPVKNKCIRLSDGRLLAPASTESMSIWLSFTDSSFDDGASWHRSPDVRPKFKPVKLVGAIQPTLWESEPGKVYMLVRTNAGEIYRSDSENYGDSWCPLYSTGLPNNNSGIDLVRMPNGMLLLVMNPISKNWGERTPLVVMRSDDNGASWTEMLQLENEPGEYSYPAIDQKDGKAYITYTHKREHVAYWELSF